MSKFGRLVPTQEKMDLHNITYAFSNIIQPVTAQAEVSLIVPDYQVFYDQGNIGSCTGYSASWMCSINNNPEKYDAYKLYKRGQQIDGDPKTKDDNDGGYIWAVLDVLRKEGHWEVNESGTQPIDPLNGIKSYYWCHTIDEMRTAFLLGRPLIFGINWYSEFMKPKIVNSEYWIGTKNNWGNVLGGHAICSYAFSDSRKAVKFRNSWGKSYPDVWISFDSVMKLLGERGEIAIAIDIINNPVPPPPPPPPPPNPTVEEIVAEVIYKGSKYAGILKKV